MADEVEWDELTATTPLTPLVLGSWLYDLDRILPVAQAALITRTDTFSSIRLRSMWTKPARCAGRWWRGTTRSTLACGGGRALGFDPG